MYNPVTGRYQRACDHRDSPRDTLGRCMICWHEGKPGGLQKFTDEEVRHFLDKNLAGVKLGGEIRRMNMINQVKTQLQNLERLDLDEAVGLASQGRTLEAEYAMLNTEAPDWLTDGLKALRRDIRDRLADTKQRRLMEARAKLVGMASPEEKRSKLQKEIDDLEKDLGISAAGSTSTT